MPKFRLLGFQIEISRKTPTKAQRQQLEVLNEEHRRFNSLTEAERSKELQDLWNQCLINAKLHVGGEIDA